MTIKTYILLFLAALSLVACNKVYQPGDFYKADGIEAIVVSVDSDNQPALILSLNEASGIDADSALLWAVAQGDGWLLPDKDQITSVYKVKSLINSTLAKKGKPTVLSDLTYYWSSSFCSETHAYACGPDGVRCYYRQNSDPTYRARAVKILNNSL